MKKAKEYAEILKLKVNEFTTEEELKKVMYWLALALFEDGLELIKIRKAHSDGAVIAIMKELDLKWKAIDRRCPNVLSKDGFKYMIKSRMNVEI